jgi:signal transduction histidine kinase
MNDKWKARFERERAARKEAESLLVERARALEAVHAQLSHLQAITLQHEKSSETSELFATVAHELNTPLGVAIAASTFAVTELKAHPDPDSVVGVARALDLVTRNLDRATELIGRFKQLAIDRVSSSSRRIDGAEYIQDVIEGLRPALRVNGIVLDDAIADLGRFDAAVGPLSQVVTNLVMNAMHHAFVDHENSESNQIRVTAALTERAVKLSVEDNGRGMTPDVAARVFEAHFTTARDSGGSGLGLHIVQEIVVQVFRGTIDFDSAPGEGTRWTVILPFDEVSGGLVRSD